MSKKNPTTSDQIVFEVKGNPHTIIKWCRRNFGARGDGWDFSTGTQKTYVIIWNNKLELMWRLWQE